MRTSSPTQFTKSTKSLKIPPSRRATTCTWSVSTRPSKSTCKAIFNSKKYYSIEETRTSIKNKLKSLKEELQDYKGKIKNQCLQDVLNGKLFKVQEKTKRVKAVTLCSEEPNAY